MATCDFFFPSKYGDFCSFFSPKKAFVQFALDLFLFPQNAKICHKKSTCQKVQFTSGHNAQLAESLTNMAACEQELLMYLVAL
jgi:hypothetical protein